MKLTGALLAVIFGFVALFARPTRQNVPCEETSCALVRGAMEDINHIEVGTTRREVEKHFDLDGGVQFPGNTRYLYPKCHYIKVEIEFVPTDSRGNELFSPNDTVTKVSQPYLAYPAKD